VERNGLTSQEEVSHLLFWLVYLVLDGHGHAFESLLEVLVILHVDLAELTSTLVVGDNDKLVSLEELISTTSEELLKFLPLLLEVVINRLSGVKSSSLLGDLLGHPKLVLLLVILDVESLRVKSFLVSGEERFWMPEALSSAVSNDTNVVFTVFATLEQIVVSGCGIAPVVG